MFNKPSRTEWVDQQQERPVQMGKIGQIATAMIRIAYASSRDDKSYSLGTAYGLTMAYVSAQTIYYVLKKALHRPPSMLGSRL